MARSEIRTNPRPESYESDTRPLTPTDSSLWRRVKLQLAWDNAVSNADFPNCYQLKNLRTGTNWRGLPVIKVGARFLSVSGQQLLYSRQLDVHAADVRAALVVCVSVLFSSWRRVVPAPAWYAPAVRRCSRCPCRPCRSSPATERQLRTAHQTPFSIRPN